MPKKSHLQIIAEHKQFLNAMIVEFQLKKQEIQILGSQLYEAPFISENLNSIGYLFEQNVLINEIMKLLITMESIE